MNDRIKQPTLIAWKIRDVHHLHMNYLQNILSNYGLHIGQPRILHTIRKLDGATQKEIADHLNISPASLATSIKRMEIYGMLNKITNRSDLRRNSVQLSAKGTRVLEDSFNELAEVDSNMVKGFSKEELVQLSQFLDRLNNNLLSLEPHLSGTRENDNPLENQVRED